VLYDIDSNLDNLLIQSPPNAGTLVTRGPLGADTGPSVGFDIQASTNANTYTGKALVSITRAADAGSRLYKLDLATGGLIDRGAISTGDGTSLTLRDITIVQSRKPSANGSSNSRDFALADSSRVTFAPEQPKKDNGLGDLML
jgi:hypothetical protein